MENYVDLETFIGAGAFGACRLFEKKDTQAKVVIKMIPIAGESIEELQRRFIIFIIQLFL